MLKFLIQANLVNPTDLAAIKKGVSSFPHEFVDIIPFSNEIHVEGKDWIPYGSTTMVELAYKGRYHGLHYNSFTFRYDIASRNRKDMLNNEYILTVEEAMHFLERKPDTEWFIRPNDDLKQFSGVVMRSQDILEWLRGATSVASSTSSQLLPTTSLVLAKPKPILAEWRWFIIGGEVVSGSMYRDKGKLKPVRELDKSIIASAQRMASEWLPDPCCVMDVAVVAASGVQTKVIEFNCINASGFYAANTSKVFSEFWRYHGGI